MAKIAPLESLSTPTKPRPHLKSCSREGITCLVCYSPIRTYVQASCKHKFCYECYSSYLKHRIDNHQFDQLICPEEHCRKNLSETFLADMLDTASYNKYQKYIHIDLPFHLSPERYCPAPGCARELNIRKNTRFFTCDCNSKICAECFGLWHEPKTCLENLDVTYKLYAEHNEVRYCYMCKSQVIRTQGCSHMKCYICDYEWCWDCGQEFIGAHFANCSKVWSPKPPKVLQNQVYYEKSKKDFKKGVKKVGGLVGTPIKFVIFVLLMILELFVKVWRCFCFILPGCRKCFEVRILKASFKDLLMDLVIAPFGAMLGVLYFVRGIVYFLIGIFNKIELWLLRISKSKRWIERNSKKFGYLSSRSLHGFVNY